MANGQIFGELGADDISEPGAIETVVDYFVSHPDRHFVYGECIHIDENGMIIGRENVRDFNLEELINDSCMIPTSSSFYRREVVETVGWFDVKGRDLDYWIRVGKEFQMYRIPDVLSRFRVHSDSQTGARKRDFYRNLLKDDCGVSRSHGGGIFSGYCKRYYRFLLVEGLRPILGFAYPLINRILKR